MEERICIKCSETKPIFSFKKWCSKKDGTATRSKDCNRCRRGVETNRRTYYPYEKDGVMVKFCQTCQNIKPLVEFAKSGKSYRNCKVCHCNEVKIAFHNATPEQLDRKRENGRRWQKTEKGRTAKAANKRKRYATDIEFRNKSLEETRKYLTREKRKEYYQRYKHKAYHQVYRARKRNQFVIDFTKDDLILRDGLDCYLCGKTKEAKDLQIEHLIPISRGGLHKPENCKLACGLCNQTKFNKTITEFKKWRGDYDRFKVKPLVAS